MDRLSIDWLPFSGPNRFEGCFTLRINGQSLDDLLRQFHMEQGWDRPDEIWGMNSGIYSLRQLAKWKQHQALVTAQCCQCGEEECASIQCRIYNDGQYVVWRDFVDFMFSDKSSAKYRDYSLFGPFTFDLHEYAQTIDRAITARDASASLSSSGSKD